MKTTILLLAFTTGLLHAQEEKLPPISADLIAKLDQWESEKKEDLQKELSGKRKEVLSLLQRHLQEATRSGNLDGAIAIRKKIEALSAGFQVTLTAAEAEAEVVMEPEKIDVAKMLIGTTWVTKDGREVSFGEKKVKVPTPERPKGVSLPITYTEEKVFLTWDNGHTAEFEFDKSWKSFNYLSGQYELKE